jgi:hypothetical protein
MGWAIQAIGAISLIAGASCGVELLMDRYATPEARSQLRAVERAPDGGAELRPSSERS